MMRTLVHLSDLHFGALRAETLDPLASCIAAIRPDLIAVSGDFTQRARRGQYAEARAFLDQLPFRKIVVPGNHDVPLYNVYARFCRPLVLYRRYISDDLEPFYADGEMAVQGINTARSWTLTKGRINERQVKLARERLGPLCGVIKIIVTHHPFDLPEPYPASALVGRARMAMTELARCGIDLFLAGHHHVGLAQPSTLRFKVSGHSALLIQAGTATSSRCRGEMNSFNVIRIGKPTIEVERFVWQHDGAASFMKQGAEVFQHGENGWSKLSGRSLSQVETASKNLVP
jgi:3',5'-cyclic AMP phosphodiesterase CpdA